MKKLRIYLGTVAAAALTGCSASYFASSGYAGDDLYATHDKTEIARRQQAEAEARKAEAEARRAEWEARLAEAQALAAENGYYESTAGDSYGSVVADTYQSAYARRLRGFNSPTYKMPSSYYNFRYGSTFNYVSAYDPAFYNIVISGDEVWVEPKYITSMFGTWGGTVYAGGWGLGWGFGPTYGWGWPYYGPYYGWGIGYHPWHDPWHYRPGWGLGWGPGWHGTSWGYRRPHNYRLDSYNGSYRPAAGLNSGRTVSTGRPGSYNSGRGSSSYNTGRGTGSYNSRGGSSGSTYNSRGSNSYNTQRNNNSNSNRNDNTRSESYNNRSNSYNGSSYNSGRSSGGSFGGGSSSGRSGGSYNSGR